MSETKRPAAIEASTAPPRARATNYPPKLAHLVAGREKRALGDVFGLKAFGVNLVRLRPGAQSAFRHRHTRQDEFLYVLEGEPTLVTDDGETALRAGMCAGLPAGGPAHQIVNRTERDAVYLEVGDRAVDDQVEYPHDDLAASKGADGAWRFTHKDGRPF